jgi:Flp pilus assembly protein TadD
MEAERWQEAVGEFDAALRLDPPNPKAHFGKGMALDGAGTRSEAARSCLSEALEEFWVML